MEREIGRCGICGGLVTLWIGPWLGVQPPVARCKSCGSAVKKELPTLPMDHAGLRWDRGVPYAPMKNQSPAGTVSAADMKAAAAPPPPKDPPERPWAPGTLIRLARTPNGARALKHPIGSYARVVCSNAVMYNKHVEIEWLRPIKDEGHGWFLSERFDYSAPALPSLEERRKTRPERPWLPNTLVRVRDIPENRIRNLVIAPGHIARVRFDHGSDRVGIDWGPEIVKKCGPSAAEDHFQAHRLEALSTAEVRAHRATQRAKKQPPTQVPFLAPPYKFSPTPGPSRIAMTPGTAWPPAWTERQRGLITDDRRRTMYQGPRVAFHMPKHLGTISSVPTSPKPAGTTWNFPSGASMEFGPTTLRPPTREECCNIPKACCSDCPKYRSDGAITFGPLELKSVEDAAQNERDHKLKDLLNRAADLILEDIVHENRKKFASWVNGHEPQVKTVPVRRPVPNLFGDSIA